MHRVHHCTLIFYLPAQCFLKAAKPCFLRKAYILTSVQVESLLSPIFKGLAVKAGEGEPMGR